MPFFLVWREARKGVFRNDPECHAFQISVDKRTTKKACSSGLEFQCRLGIASIMPLSELDMSRKRFPFSVVL
jgi:hypothetical protein